MGATYLIDTNAISDYLGGKLPLVGLDFMDTVMDDSPTISIINRIELLGHNRPELAKFKIAVGGGMYLNRQKSSFYEPLFYENLEASNYPMPLLLLQP